MDLRCDFCKHPLTCVLLNRHDGTPVYACPQCIRKGERAHWRGVAVEPHVFGETHRHGWVYCGDAKMRCISVESAVHNHVFAPPPPRRCVSTFATLPQHTRSHFHTHAADDVDSHSDSDSDTYSTDADMDVVDGFTIISARA